MSEVVYTIVVQAVYELMRCDLQIDISDLSLMTQACCTAVSRWPVTRNLCKNKTSDGLCDFRVKITVFQNGNEVKYVKYNSCKGKNLCWC